MNLFEEKKTLLKTILLGLIFSSLFISWNELLEPTLSIRYFTLGIFLLFFVLLETKEFENLKIPQSLVFIIVIYVLGSISSLFLKPYASLFPAIHNIIILPIILVSGLLLKNHKDKIGILFTIAFTLIICYGYIDFFKLSKLDYSSSYQIKSFFNHRNHLASFIMLSIPLLMFYFRNLNNNILKIVLIIIISFSLILLSILYSRMGWFGLMFILCGFILTMKNTLFKVVALLFIIGSCIILLNNTSSSKSTETDQRQKMSIVDRVHMWKGSLELIKKNPLLGIGNGNWQTNINKFGYENTSAANGLTLFSNPHNDFLLLSSEKGLFVGLSYFCFLLVLLIYSIRDYLITKNSWQTIFFILFVFVSSVSFPFEKHETTLLLILVISNIDFNPENEVRHFSLKKVIVLLLFALFSVTCFINMKIDMYNLQLHKNRYLGTKFPLTSYNNSLKSYQFIDRMGFPTHWFMANHLMKKGDYKSADIFLENCLVYSPYHHVVLSDFGVCKLMLGDTLKAKNYLDTALEQNPLYANALLNKASILVLQKDYVNALNLIHKIDDPKLEKNKLYLLQLIQNNILPI